MTGGGDVRSSRCCDDFLTIFANGVFVREPRRTQPQITRYDDLWCFEEFLFCDDSLGRMGVTGQRVGGRRDDAQRWTIDPRLVNDRAGLGDLFSLARREFRVATNAEYEGEKEKNAEFSARGWIETREGMDAFITAQRSVQTRGLTPLVP
ncbi:unnamed protein product [Hapterophycus canaliculatus]